MSPRRQRQLAGAVALGLGCYLVRHLTRRPPLTVDAPELGTLLTAHWPDHDVDPAQWRAERWAWARARVMERDDYLVMSRQGLSTALQAELAEWDRQHSGR